MDFRNICPNVNMDSIRAVIPPLPAMPAALSKIKLPKSMAKLKSRKIFRSSREDVQRSSSKKSVSSIREAPPIPPSGFVNHTPTRISTISSLMNQTTSGGSMEDDYQRNTYRRAGSIDDYPTPLSQKSERHHHRKTISPLKVPARTPEPSSESPQPPKLSFTEKLQKGYHDFSEFKLKHLFVKKTVVRRDNIEIGYYVDRYEEDREREVIEEAEDDRKIANNYEIKFQTAREGAEDSFEESPDEGSPDLQPHIKRKKPIKSVSEQSGDESGMELTPPKRRPGIAATRFARVRSPALSMSDEEIELHDLNEEPELSNISAVKKGAEKSSKVNEESPAATDPKNEDKQKPKGFKERMETRLSKYKASRENLDKAEDLNKEDEEEGQAGKTPNAEKPLSAIKENFKRLQKSIKLPTSSNNNNNNNAVASDANENEDNDESNKTKLSKTRQFTERLKRFRSVDNVDNGTTENDKEEEQPTHIKSTIATKFQDLKKSLKKKPSVDVGQTDEESSPQRESKHGDSLLEKLKHIRARKQPTGNDDPDDDEEGGETYKESFAARAKLQLEKGVVIASQMPHITKKKLNETKRYFHRSPSKADKKSDKSNENKRDEDEAEEESLEIEDNTSKAVVPRRRFSEVSENYDAKEEYLREIAEGQEQIAAQSATVAWTTKPIITSSLDLEDEEDIAADYPRVLIHQDNSDTFESTLIIAVTRSRTHTPTPIITELPPDPPSPPTKIESKPATSANSNWIPNKDIISSFLEMTPPSQRNTPKEFNVSNIREKLSSQSIDSNSDSDLWINQKLNKKNYRKASVIELSAPEDQEEAWRVKSSHEDNNKIYKTKSIDIFEANARRGGALNAFEDFDDELKNTPVIEIKHEQERKQEIISRRERNIDSFEHDSSEELDAADDDNSSRVTKILVINKRDKNIKEADRIIRSQELSCEKNTANDLCIRELEDIELKINEPDLYERSNSDGEMHNHPLSVTPSRPPSMSPPPPPLPQRQPSIRIIQTAVKKDCLPSSTSTPSSPSPSPPPSSTSSSSSPPPPPPPPPPPTLPQIKPPIPPNRPTKMKPCETPAPKPPEPVASVPRTSKPLVKTSSLRLTYNEQVNPKDKGKVNKLISRFEQPTSESKQRPRIIPRRPIIHPDSSENSDDEIEEKPLSQRNFDESERDVTPTNQPIKMTKSLSIDSPDLLNHNIEEVQILPRMRKIASDRIKTENHPTHLEKHISIPQISIASNPDINSNLSGPNSEYGSPITYPSSLVSSTEATPLSVRKEPDLLQTRRSRRSMTRDDERFYSFDSDEENSYYSISSTNSSRYVVEL
ncbi:PIP82 isoform 1-T2 [Glossina fuscipes fuscipes]